KEADAATRKVFDEYLKLTKNNHSALKRLIQRKGIEGYSQDVGRVVANFIYSNARQGAAGLNAGTMDRAINDIPKEQGELKDLAMGLRSYIRDPQEEGQAVRGMLFAQYLGGSLASAVVNMTQPFAVTLPWLSQFGGIRAASGQMARALKDMGTRGMKYEADLAHALKSAEDDGVVSPQEVHQLMAQARGAGGLRSGDGTKSGDARAAAGNAWERAKVAWGQPFALAEQFNRRSTFIAAFRIAKAQGMPDPGAFARKAVLETQFVYSKANKPQWARGAIGGTLFCVDDATEALTSQGWKTVDELRRGDLVASFDMATESLVWKPVKKVFQKHMDGEMVHVKDRNLDMFMTPDHRVVTYREERVPGYRNKYHRRLQIQEAQDLNSKDCIPVAAPFLHEPSGAPLSDPQVRMIGWIVTEGYFVKKNRGRTEWGGHLRIGQNEGHKADLIRRDLTAAGLPWVEHKWTYDGGNADHVYFNIKKSACADFRDMLPAKVLTPDLLMRMTTDQIRQLVDVMVMADGSTGKTGARCFIQNPGQTLDAFQMALTMIGVAFSVHQHGPGARKVVLKEAKWYTLSRTKGERVQFKGRVWCPLVQDTHTWVARRGGRVFITHNTFKTYSVSYLELMQRMWKQGGPEGKRAVGWALAMLLLMGGAGGVPFLEDAEDLIDGVGQMMGYNLSSKQWRKEALAGIVGKELAEFLEQGVSGLPGAPIDVSGRLGMGNLLPGTGLLLTKQSRERDLLEVAGPAGDLVMRGFTAGRKVLTGDVAGAALEVSPTAVRNAFKGADMAASGM
ncbi:MAG: PLxRFG domain-containing protein, partial [Pseudomonadota bacterium]